MKNENQLKGKTIVITGVSSGFGRGVTIKLTQLGANVVGVARRGKVLDALSLQIDGEEGTFIPIVGDVSDPETIEGLATTAKNKIWRHRHMDKQCGSRGIGLFLGDSY